MLDENNSEIIPASKSKPVNATMSKVKSRLFDFLSTKTQQVKEDNEKKEDKKPALMNPKRLMELSQPRKKLEIRDCFTAGKKSLGMIVY